MKNIDIKEFMKLVISCLVYIVVATLFGEYIISRNINILLQIGALFVMMMYTVLQIRYVVRYVYNLINF